MNVSRPLRAVLLLLVSATGWMVPVSRLTAQAPGEVRYAPDRHRGEGPFERLIIRGVNLIDGTGAPPRGPVDVVVEGNRITDIVNVGVPGFTPLEVIRGATKHGAEALYESKGEPIPFGVVRPGMLADLVLIRENPLDDLKVLYGTGAVRLNDESGRAERVGGVRYTIKDGIVYDAKLLLADVKAMVDAQKRERGITLLPDVPWRADEAIPSSGGR